MKLITQFYRFAKKFGFKGFGIYLKLILGKTDNIFLPEIVSPITLRSKTSDIPTFYHIFFYDHYKINLKFQPETIIDAGANIGLATIYFANKYPKSKIISIEPENSNFKMLEKNILNYPNVKAIKKALSNLSNQVLNIVDKGYGKWGFITELKEESSGYNLTNCIETVTIEDIMKEENFKIIDILKIDIEGAEKELFESNTLFWLPRTRCIIIELHDWMKKGCSKSVFEAITKYNFSFSLKGENLVFINEDIH